MEGLGGKAQSEWLPQELTAGGGWVGSKELTALLAQRGLPARPQERGSVPGARQDRGQRPHSVGVGGLCPRLAQIDPPGTLT